MKLSRNVILSYQILVAHKLRTLLSVGGIAVGVAVFVTAVSAGLGAQKRILSTIRDMGANLIIVNAGQSHLLVGRRRHITMVTTLVPADARAIARECRSVALAAPVSRKKMLLRWGEEIASTNVLGLTAEALTICNITITSGRPFRAEEDRARRRLAIVGPAVVKNLFNGSDPVGEHFRIGRVQFEVLGVAGPKGMDMTGRDQDDFVIVPMQTAMRRLLNVPYIQTVLVQARSGAVLKSAEREIRRLLRQRHRLGKKRDDFAIENQAVLLETERAAVLATTLLVSSAAGVSLLVGGVGILAIMLISIRERTREIGLRRAVGALRRDIRTQFMLESVMLAGAGGVMGVIGGLCATWIVSALGPWETVISWLAVGIGLTFSVTIGIVFGVYPAIRAASLEPIEALKSEGQQ